MRIVMVEGEDRNACLFVHRVVNACSGIRGAAETMLWAEDRGDLDAVFNQGVQNMLSIGDLIAIPVKPQRNEVRAFIVRLTSNCSSPRMTRCW